MIRFRSSLLLIALGVLLPACKPAGKLPATTQPATTMPVGVTGDLTRTLQVGDVQRSYILHIPPNASAPLPLVLVFHGSGGTAAGMVKLSHFNDVADAHGILAAYPDGIDKHWNIGADARSEADDLGFVDGLLADIARLKPVNPGRIYACGMSNGGFFSLRLACERSETFAGIGVVAAGLLEQTAQSCHPGRRVPAIFLNGDADPLVPYAGGKIRATRFRSEDTILSAEQSAQFWANAGSAAAENESQELSMRDATDATRVTRTNFSPTVELWTVHGGGHTWPGGYQYLGERLIGKTTRQIDASEEIWNFFARQSPAPR